MRKAAYSTYLTMHTPAILRLALVLLLLGCGEAYTQLGKVVKELSILDATEGIMDRTRQMEVIISELYDHTRAVDRLLQGQNSHFDNQVHEALDIIDSVGKDQA